MVFSLVMHLTQEPPSSSRRIFIGSIHSPLSGLPYRSFNDPEALTADYFNTDD
jgi:hypothetical protein